jgi:hypothetical protein
MSDILPATTGGLFPSRRVQRQVIRARERVGAEAAVEVARARAVEVVEVAKIEAIGTVATVAMAETSGVAQHEALHAQRNPEVAERFSYLARTATVAMGTRLDRLGTRLG